MISLYSNIQKKELIESYYKVASMSKVTPEEALDSVVQDGINAGIKIL